MMNQERPVLETVDSPNKNHRIFSISRRDIDTTFKLLDIESSRVGKLAELHWVGEIENQDGHLTKFRQLGIKKEISKEAVFLSYDGFRQGKYKELGSSFFNLGGDYLCHPYNSNIYQIPNDKFVGFSRGNPHILEQEGALDVNNASIEIKNASIFDFDYKNGVMINLRASFDGLMTHDSIDGNVRILLTFDDIKNDNSD